jgi:hypothetical protein
MPRDPIASGQLFPGSFTRTRCLGVSLKSFPGTPVKDRSQIVFDFWLNLVKCVENSRNCRKLRTQFFWIRGEKYYNFCYTHLVWFWIFLAWKIGMWKAKIWHNSQSTSLLYPIFGYVVYHVMTSFWDKICTKLCGKSFYINCFPIMQNLPRRFL